MRSVHFGLAIGVVLAVGACERSLDGTKCPCTGADECCLELDRCQPKGECPQPTWRGFAAAPEEPREAQHCGPLIDDLEDNDGVICLDEGRVGPWYSTSDGRGRLFPLASNTPLNPSPEPGTRNLALHTDFNHDVSAADSEGPFFALVGIDLQYNGRKYGHYDASRYVGISFRARGSCKTVDVRVNTMASTLVNWGGSCESECTPWSHPIEVTDEWTHFEIPFDRFAQAQDTESHPLDPTILTNIQFQFVSVYTKDPVDLWIDDVVFLSPPE